MFILHHIWCVVCFESNEVKEGTGILYMEFCDKEVHVE